MKFYIAVVVCWMLCVTTFAQGTKEDYHRANTLEQSTRGTVFRARVEPHWNGDTFWYAVNTASGAREYFLVDAEKGTREKIADPKKLESTSKPSMEIRPSSRTGDETSILFVNTTPSAVRLFWIDEGGGRKAYGEIAAGDRRSIHTYEGHVWLVVDAKDQTLGVFEAGEVADEVTISTTKTTQPATRPAAARQRWRDQSNVSPDGHWRAVIRNGNVILQQSNDDGGAEFSLTSDARNGDGFNGEFFWSPDSKHLVAMRTLDGDHRKVYLVESSPKDQLQPKLITLDYPKPGDRLAIDKPHLFNIEKRREIAVDDALFRNPWSVEDVRWDEDSSRFTFLFNQRGHQALRVLAVDSVSGNVKPIIEEISKTFIDYSGKFFIHYLPKTNEIIWMSERDGWNHLCLYDARSGEVKNQITRGKWVVRGVERVDEENRQIYFRCGGYYADQDPYYVHFARVNFDGSDLTLLTPGDGTHSIGYSPDGKYFIDTYSRVDLPPVNELRRTSDGKLICELEKADISKLQKTGWQMPERFVAKGRDGKTDIFGVIFRPTNFDPKKKYPVIENIYAGPQDSFVPKAFGRHFSEQSMAELGFVVVKIDGMGTSNRSKAFHDVCWHNIGDGGFPDRILWMKAAAAKYPQMDLSRGVGIYGTSAGGQNALRALEAFGDFYKVAVADCGCHDNRMDKIWWNEQWMGYPIGPWYSDQSNVTNANNMNGKLLLIVGELDRNVDPASTMQVVNALIAANKDFDLLVIPGADHGQDGAYGNRRREDFFVRNLLGVEPRR